MCLFPKHVPITLKDGTKHYLDVPCGKCIECLQNRTHDWEFRMKHEKVNSQMSLFVTLTYDDFFLPKDGVQVSDCQKFFKKLRNRGLEFRYFCIGEYGTQTHRPHYHCILFVKSEQSYHDVCMYVHESWFNGFLQIKQVTSGRIHYCIAYLIGQKILPDKNKPFTLVSKRPPIGSSLLENDEFVKMVKDNNFEYVYRNGKKVHCPRFYKRKLQETVVKSIDIFKIYCSKCQDEYKRKIDYLSNHSVSNRIEFLRCSPHVDTKNITDSTLFDLIRYNNFIKSENSNKDFILKQRSKKLRND